MTDREDPAGAVNRATCAAEVRVRRATRHAVLIPRFGVNMHPVIEPLFGAIHRALRDTTHTEESAP